MDVIFKELSSEICRNLNHKIADIKHKRKEFEVVNWIWIKSGFRDDEAFDMFISYYTENNKYTEYHNMYINNIYEQIRYFTRANNVYKEKGYKENLIKLMLDISQLDLIAIDQNNNIYTELEKKIDELLNDQIVYKKYFEVTDKYLSFVSPKIKTKFVNQINELRNIYSRIINKEKVHSLLKTQNLLN